jgi:hypothetical protein
MPKNYFKLIQTTWRCDLNSCPNRGLTCLVKDRRHFPLNVNDLKSWSAAIVDGTTTVHTPPMSMHPRPAKAPKKRKQSGFSSDPEDSIRPHKFLPNINVHVHNDSAKASNIIKHTSSTSPSPPQKQIIPSSPPFDHESDASGTMMENASLAEYIDWHVFRAPEDTDALLAALDSLNKESCKLNQLKKFSPETWRTLGIPIGIGMALGDEVGRFEKQRRSNGKHIFYLS